MHVYCYIQHNLIPLTLGLKKNKTPNKRLPWQTFNFPSYFGQIYRPGSIKRKIIVPLRRKHRIRRGNPEPSSSLKNSGLNQSLNNYRGYENRFKISKFIEKYIKNAATIIFVIFLVKYLVPLFPGQF